MNIFFPILFSVLLQNYYTRNKLIKPRQLFPKPLHKERVSGTIQIIIKTIPIEPSKNNYFKNFLST